MIAAYRKMVRSLAYDICEVAVTTYVVAKAFNKGFTRPTRSRSNHLFHFGDIQVGLDTASTYRPTWPANGSACARTR